MNKIFWNGAAPKYDIRDWASEREKMGKGVTLTEEEFPRLISGLIIANSSDGLVIKGIGHMKFDEY